MIDLKKVRCPNLNHTNMNPMVHYCPNCGEKFRSASSARCDEAKHASRRKDGNTYCCDCGKSLKK